MSALFWRYLTRDRDVGQSELFDDQEAAEAWLTESWRDLLAQGIEVVELTDEGGESLYRMSLLPE